jgi:class 3 adenylate cyclase
LVDLGAWSIRSWRPFSWLIAVLFAAVGGLVGYLSDYNSMFPALGGPNGFFFDLTLKVSQTWRRDIPKVPAVFVAVDGPSLSAPELAALPRALFQPIWARLIDGLLEAEARRIAFDFVFAYAGTDFKAGSFTLPGYDRSLIDSLTRGRGKIVLGRFPNLPPAPPFVAAVGRSKVGVLDLQLESDGRARSAATLVRLANGRIALSFAALGAGLSVRQALATQRLLITPSAPLADTPTYSLATLLDCMASPDGAAHVRKAVEGRIVVVGTALLGEDEHRGPTRFLGYASPSSPKEPCAPHIGTIKRPEPENGPGALLQIALIQSAASSTVVTLAPAWLRAIAGLVLAFLFAIIASRDEIALTIGEHNVSTRLTIARQLIRSVAIGLAGPNLLGGCAIVACFVVADLWLPLGYPIIAANFAFGFIVVLRSARYRTVFRRLYRTAGRYLPPERLVTLARSGFGEPPEGQEREVSILLADFIGFTSFSNRSDLTASEVVRVASRYFNLMQAAIDRHEGCSDKFLGDAVLAFWNGISDEPDHAVKALTAAQEIISAVQHADGSREHRLDARAVICSGRVYVGDFGAKNRSNFTIIGPAVNETFRLEKVPDAYGLPLLVAASTADMIMASKSEASAELLADNVLVRIDDLDLKGFAGSRSVYALVPRDDPGLAEFVAGREALEQKMLREGLAHLGNVDDGMLRQAAKILSDRHRTTS